MTDLKMFEIVLHQSMAEAYLSIRKILSEFFLMSLDRF